MKTPIPWKNENNVCIRGANGRAVCFWACSHPSTIPQTREDFDFIVQAVNSHEALVEVAEAAEQGVKLLERGLREPENMQTAIESSLSMLRYTIAEGKI